MQRNEAIRTAQAAFMAWLSGNSEKAYGLTHRYSVGRWDVYSLDVAQWHILLSDNGGKLEYIADCSNVD